MIPGENAWELKISSKTKYFNQGETGRTYNFYEGIKMIFSLGSSNTIIYIGPMIIRDKWKTYNGGLRPGHSIPMWKHAFKLQYRKKDTKYAYELFIIDIGWKKDNSLKHDNK